MLIHYAILLPVLGVVLMLYSISYPKKSGMFIPLAATILFFVASLSAAHVEVPLRSNANYSGQFGVVVYNHYSSWPLIYLWFGLGIVMLVNTFYIGMCTMKEVPDGDSEE